MGHEDKSLLTIVIIAIVVLIVLWVIFAVKRRRDDEDDSDDEGGSRHRRNRRGKGTGKPDPVGGVVVKTTAPGETTISWDPAFNACSYRVFLNTCDAPQGANKASCGGGSGKCCPTEPCDSCVSLTNYEKIVETEGTSIIVESCTGCICFLIVPYNCNGDAGECNEVRFAYPECLLPCIQGRMKWSNCDGTHIEWDCPKCCDTVNIYVDGTLFESVPCEDGCVTLEQIPECIEIGLQCESACGVGDITLVREAHHQPHAAMLAEAQNFRARRKQKPQPKASLKRNATNKSAAKRPINRPTANRQQRFRL